MTGKWTLATCALLILPGMAAAQIAIGGQHGLTSPNEAFLAELQAGEKSADVELSPDTDLLAFTRDSLGVGPEAYVAPLIIPASDANGDSQSSDYFYSFVGWYQAGDGCHMVPAYLPNGPGSVEIVNFFIFAYDNDTNDVSFSLLRKDNFTTSSATIMGTVSTSGASTSIQVVGDTTITDPIVSNNYNYFVAWCWPGIDGDYRILSFWIFYNVS